MKLTFQEKFGYGLGDTASNFFWATIMSFLMFYYTDIFGLPAAAVGTLFLFARIFDGASDFVMGAIADRTKTRWGRFRPYLLWTGLPLAAVATLTFTTPDLAPSGKLIYAWVTYNLLMILYTAINIPYSALSGVMTDDPLDRTSLNSYRMTLAQVGGFIVNAATLPLIAYFGHGNQSKGYPMTIAVFGLAATVLFLVAFATTRERIQPAPEQRTKLLQDLRSLLGNRHWVVMFLAGVLDLAFIIVRAGTLVYYCKYYLRLDEKQTSTFLVLGNVGFIAGALITRFAVQALGKKHAFIAAHLLFALSAAAAYLVPPQWTAAAFSLQALHGFAGGLNATLYWAMIADTADFAEWKFRVRTTGIVFSATTCSQKVGMGIGGALAGYLLTNFGYIAGATQTAHANQGILLLVSLIPAAGFMVVVAVFQFYGLDEQFCRTMRVDLTERRRSRSIPVPEGAAA
jgi:GPH family glycoside/pentoside/hexuronide:cation symporter